MNHPTIILRHRKENRKKCSLTPLEGKENFHFYRYPDAIQSDKLPCVNEYLLLQVGEKPLSKEDHHKGLFVVDSTWRYSERMIRSLPPMKKRGIPPGFVTAYPRKQEDCLLPDQGLASIEALFIAYTLLGWNTEGLLDSYYWRDDFLEKNASKLKLFLS